MKNRSCSIVIVCLTASAVTGQDFDLTRYSIDSGGVIRSTGGDFELSGTIGQPDAGVLRGGAFELTGGFWFQVAPTDCDEDGAVNLFDHSAFIDCLTGPANALSSGCECFDADRSGEVDLLDFAALQTVFSQS